MQKIRQSMLLTSLIIVAVLLTSYLMISTDRLSHINRASVSMFTGVLVWVVFSVSGNNIHNTNLNHYVLKSVEVILFLLATNSIISIMNNNGVFDSLKTWFRMKNAKTLLWSLTLVTFCISANVDNLTTSMLMISIMSQIVTSNRQRVLYSISILIAANLGGSFTVIGDITNLYLWTHQVVSASSFAAGLFLPAITSLVVFNLLISSLIIGRVEMSSSLSNFSDEVYLPVWQKITLLLVGLASIWFVPTFSSLTSLPPFLGALTVLALILMIDGIFNFKRYRNQSFVRRKVFRTNEYVGTHLILYILGCGLGIGALVECGALSFIGHWLMTNIHNVYIYGGVIGFISGFIDNIPLVLIGLHIFPVDFTSSTADFAVNGQYWLLLSFCSALGCSLLYIGSLAGHAVADSQNIKLGYYFRHITWRVLLAWVAGIVVFYLVH